MQQFTCPYNRQFCGASASAISMHPVLRNNLIVEIENYLYVDTAVCYYQFFVPESDLDMKNNRYFFEVEFERLSNVNAYIMNGTATETSDESISINFFSGYKFQYEAENNQIFMTMTGDAPDDDDDDPSFKFQIKLYTFRVTPYTEEEIA